MNSVFLLRAVIHEFDVIGSACYDTRWCSRVTDSVLADLCSDLVPKITCQLCEPGLSPASGFEHPASTLPTRFPVALGIGHGHACGLANTCALVYVAA